ncbi:MAG: excinuclease ABC subunit UvrC [Gemmatimonadetes bacterium]|nr:MAG: excinuclease ABC subunit UvrC [Gemmatimonadota bacterium]
MSTLADKLAALPDYPGCYLFRDREGTIIYIGKAKVLKNRVRSYFQQSRKGDPKLDALRKNIATFEYIVTGSEKEALVLEAQLIKRHSPRYNIMLKDDKRQPYIKVTTNETYPRIVIVRRVDNKDGARYFGPFTYSTAMRQLVDTIQKVFPIRTCDNPMPKKSCLMYHINRCIAPCEHLCDPADYAHMVEEICTFLSGKTTDLLESLKKRMWAAADNKEYEKAARFRDQIRAIEDIKQKQKIVSADIADRDVLAIAVDGDDICGVVLQVREGRLLGKVHYFLTGAMDTPRTEIFAAFAQQYYLRAQLVPDEVILQYPLVEEAAFLAWLSERRGKKVTVFYPQRGKKLNLVLMAEENARIILEGHKIQKDKRKKRVPKSVHELQKALKLKKLPRVIEAFDISNLQGTDAVAGMVYFENGQPRKGEYRRFKMTTTGPDDFEMIKEAVSRRYKRLLEEKKEMPDLILIDGGKGQLSHACEALQALGIDVETQDIIGLAKRREEVFLPGKPFPIMISRTSPALYLLQRVRDEVHRYSVEYHRKLREKRYKTSELDAIKGVGEKRKTALLRHFGSVNRVKGATVEQLLQVDGMTKPAALAIWQYFHEAAEQTKPNPPNTSPEEPPKRKYNLQKR